MAKRIKSKDGLRFAMVTKPSPRRTSTGWSSILPFLSQSLVHFPRPINTCFVDLLRVPSLRKKTLHKVSPLLEQFLGFFIFISFTLFLELSLKIQLIKDLLQPNSKV